MRKRGQAALEFLMTYGWAILVVLVVIGALAYFGVLNPSILLPEKCTLTTGLACKDHRIDSTSNTIKFSFENGMGSGMYITNVNASGKGTNYFKLCAVYMNGTVLNDAGADASAYHTNCTNATSGGNCGYGAKIGYWHIANGEGGTVTIQCDYANGVAGFAGKTKLDFFITYFADDSTETFKHTMTGELLARNEG